MGELYAFSVRIGEALPQVFQRSYPIVMPSTDMLMAASLLRFHEIDALPIEFRPTTKKRLAVFGYSCLSKLLKTKTTNYESFMRLPARRAALKLSSIGVNLDIPDLLRIFRKTRFGFAWVESDKLGGFASLRDLLELYLGGVIETDLKVADLASPIFSMPPETSLREVLEEMFNRKIRRIFLKDRNTVITDRRIIGYVFSPSMLENVSKNPELLLDASTGDLDLVKPAKVRDSLSAKKAAQLIRKQPDECLICDKGVITPWDLVMKPLAARRLIIRD
jgi:CBS domain-containing protein